MNRYEFTSIVYDELALDPDNRRANRIIDAADEYAAGQAVRGPERDSTALDHIHMVVKDEAYQRGYEQAKAEYDAKLEKVKSRFKDHYYHKGYEQGKADAAPKWTPVTEKLPEEHDTMFAKYWGTDRWNEYMFRKKSDLVEVTVELEDGTRYTDASRTHDGKWDVEERLGAVKKKVVAWHYMSEPWEGE